MARPKKDGLDYFPFDTDILNDRKIRRLLSEHGAKGFSVYVGVLCVIYRDKGYWTKYNEELCFDVADDLKAGIDDKLVSEVIRACVKYGLFDEKLFTESEILTSKGIQLRYISAKRNGVIAAEMRVITVKTPVITAETGVSTVESTQSKGKERKEKESKVLDTNVSVGEAPPKVDMFIDEERNLYKRTQKTIESIREFIKNRRPVIPEPYMEYWNLFAVKYGYTQVLSLNDKRKEKISVRLKEEHFDILKILYHAANSEGIKQIGQGTWFTFDWLIANQTNYIKVLEGNYKRSKPAEQDSEPQSAAAQAILKELNR